MAAFYRKLVYKKIIQSIVRSDLVAGDARHLVRLCDTSKKYSGHHPQLKVPLSALRPTDSIDLNKLQSQIPDVESITKDDGHLYVKVHPHKFNKNVLSTVLQQRSQFGYLDDDTEVKPKHVVVEFSSPNVAKPFHAGHLRSTLIGNFIANLYESLGHTVTRLNFLGDWGTQFGLLLTGYHRYGDPRKLEDDPLLHLFEVYVRVNQDVRKEQAVKSNDTYTEGLHTFVQLERGGESEMKLWQEFCDISRQEYSRMYQRLGVHFTAVHSESMYKEAAANLVQDLTQQGSLKTDERGVGYIELSGPGGRTIQSKLAKSDGSTLYLTRDVVAAMDRQEKLNFDTMHYVVDQSQSEHFNQLAAMLRMLGHEWSQQPHFHVPFGQVQGMSTRRGDVVFLRDILDEAARRMTDSLKGKGSTRSDIDIDEVAEALGISSIIVQDLRVRRTASYTFSWERMLNFKSDSGVFLQYCHARLSSVLRSHDDVAMGEVCDGGGLSEDAACQLLLHIASYPDTVQEAVSTLEPCVIVQYLFKLAHLSNAAYKQLPVKTQDTPVAKARLALFDCSRQTLANGLKLLGIVPLEKM